MDPFDAVCSGANADDVISGILTVNSTFSSKPIETEDDTTIASAFSMSSTSAQQDLVDIVEDFGEKESSVSSVTSFSLDNEDLLALDVEMSSFQECCEDEEEHITGMLTNPVSTEPLDAKFQNDFGVPTGLTSVQIQPNEPETLEGDLLAASNDLFVDTAETNQAPPSADILDLPDSMEKKPDVSKDGSSDVDLDAIVHDILGKTEVDVGSVENITDVWTTAVNDLLDANRDNDNDGEKHLEKETSPEITVDLADAEETVVQKDADSEKVLLRNKGEDQGTCLYPDGISSEGDEDNQKSPGGADMDFAVLELDTSQLNLDHSKQKRSLSKKGSIARRKRPSRSSLIKTAADSPETQDPADSGPQSPGSGPGVDEVFGDQQSPADNVPPSPATEAQPEASKVRLSAVPFKIPLVMPGLQDLNKSKLFNQEERSSEGVEPAVKSPVKAQSQPPIILPKPATKVQKDSQNFHVSSQCSTSLSGSSGVTHGVAGEPTNGRVNSLGSKHVTDSVDRGKTDSVSSISSAETSQVDGVGSFVFGVKAVRADSISSVDSSCKLSRGDSTSSVDTVPEVSTPPRKGSITSTAYTPIAFRPRHGSITVLDADNKAVDSGLLSTPPAVPEVKKIQTVEPVWLAEMKARQEGGDGDVVAAAKRRSATKNRNSSGDATGDVKSSTSPDEVSNKMVHEREPEKPSWLKAANEKSPQKMETDRHENGQDTKDAVLSPLWVDKLKRSVVSTTPKTGNKEENQKSTAQTSGSADTSSVIQAVGRNQYVPSWLKTAQLQKKSPSSLGPFGAGAAVSNRGDIAANSPDKLMSAYETPKWKLELAEKKKQREAGTIPEVSPASETQPEVPQWRKQLSQRKKQPGPVSADSDGNTGSAGLDWAKKAEERRARLLKSGLLDTEPQQQS